MAIILPDRKDGTNPSKKNIQGTGDETRPIGIPTFEDKILQRAVVMVLEAVYEQDFLDCSYGFRPGRSAHQALATLWQRTMKTGGGWMVEVDIRKFFDTLDHAHLRELLRRRVRDGVLLRLIDKWLKAGVLEDGTLTVPAKGSPQGGVISPLLANVYLHYVLDLWFEQEVQPRLKGRAFLIRYADDFVIGFTNEEDARRVLEVLPKRFARYGLTVHPDKTRLVPFRSPASSEGGGVLETVPPQGHSTCWGFPTHFCGPLASGEIGWSSVARLPTDSEEQSGRLPIGAGTTAICRSRTSAPDIGAETARSLRVLWGSRATTKRCAGSGTQ